MLQCTCLADLNFLARLLPELYFTHSNYYYYNCDPPRENQQKGDNTGTRAMHGHASVTTDTDMRIFNEKTESVTEAFVWQDITR